MKSIHSTHCSCQISYYTSRLYQTPFHCNFSINLFIQIIYLCHYVFKHTKKTDLSHIILAWRLASENIWRNISRWISPRSNSKNKQEIILCKNKISNDIFCGPLWVLLCILMTKLEKKERTERKCYNYNKKLEIIHINLLIFISVFIYLEDYWQKKIIYIYIY